MSDDIKLLNADGTPVNQTPPPLGPNGKPMNRFEVRMRRHPGGEVEKAIFINGEKLDWTIDVSAYMEACKMGPHFKKAVQDDIAKHFVDSVSEVVGRHVTVDDIKKATIVGWI